MDDLNTNDGNDVLARYCLGTLLPRWILQRQKVEPEWRKYFAAFTNHPEFDTAGTWNLPDKAKKGSSDTFPDLTGQKCNSAFSLLARTVFSGNRINFSLLADEVSHLPQPMGQFHEDGDAERAEFANLEPAVDADPAVASAAGDPALMPPADPMLEQVAPDASQIAAGMQSLMDRMSEACDEVEELGKAALSGAIYGEGCIEEYAMKLEDHGFHQVAPGQFDIYETSLDMLGSRWVSVWSVWRDREAKSRTDGDGYAIFDPASPFDFVKMLNDPLADRMAVFEILNQSKTQEQNGVGTVAVPTVQGKSPPANIALLASGRPIHLYRFHCRVPRRILEQFIAERDGVEKPTDADQDVSAFEPVEVACVIANGRTVRMVESEPESRLLHVWEWERTPDMPWAIGVAARVEPQQKSLMKAVRALEDMILRSAKLLLAGKRNKINGDLETVLENEDFIDIDEGCPDVTKALQQFKIEAPVGALQSWIGFILELADLTSLIPRVSQGQSDGSDPKTLGEIQRRLEQSGLWMMRVAGNFDSMVEEILYSRYEFNMANPDVDPRLKGNFKLRVEGAQTFNDRYLTASKIGQALTMALGNEQLSAMTKIEPGWRQYLMANGIDADLWVKSASEMMQDAQRMQEQAGGLEGEASAVQQAQINRLMAEARNKDADTELKRAAAAAKQAEMVRKDAEAVHKMTQPAKTEPTSRQGAEAPSSKPVVAA